MSRMAACVAVLRTTLHSRSASVDRDRKAGIGPGNSLRAISNPGSWEFFNFSAFL